MTSPDQNLRPAVTSSGPQEQPHRGTGSPPIGIADLCQSLAGGLASVISSLFKVPVDLAPAGLAEQSYAAFLASLTDAGCCWLLEARPQIGARVPASRPIWLELSRSAAQAMVDRLLGGCGQHLPDRPPTYIERRLLRRFVDAAAEQLTRLWAGRLGLVIGAVDEGPDSEPGPGRREPVLGQEVLVLTWVLDLGGRRSTLRLSIPSELASRIGQGPASERGPAGLQGLSGGPAELSVVAQETRLPQADLANLSPGDVLLTDAEADGKVIVRLNGKDMFAAQLGSRNGKRAITITRPLDNP